MRSKSFRFQEFSECFGEDVYEAISLKTCVEKRVTIGAPGPVSMKSQIEAGKAYLESEPALKVN